MHFLNDLAIFQEESLRSFLLFSLKIEREDYMPRIGWDELFMGVVDLYAKRSVCKHYPAGVIFVRDNRILAAGYSGPPKGEVHCNEVGCAKEDENGNKLPSESGLCRGAHAELNAVMNANVEGVILTGATVYCTFSPCPGCAKSLSNLGIKEFVYKIPYEDLKRPADLFRRRGILLRHFGN